MTAPTLADEIATKRARIATLRASIDGLTTELNTERIKLAALEEFAAKQQPTPEPSLEPEPEVPKPKRARSRWTDGTINPAPKREGNYRRAKPVRERINEPTETVPMKVLLIKALMEQFPVHGSTARNLQDYIETQWGRKTTNASINVELNGLKKMGEVKYENQLWRLIMKRGN